MLLRCMIIFGLLTPLMGCQTFHHLSMSKNPSHLPKIEAIVHKAPMFNRVDAAGEMNLRLYTGARQAWISLHGDPRDIGDVTWTVQRKTIIIRFASILPLHGPVDIGLGVPQLHEMTYRGSGEIIGRRMSSGQLDINISNDGLTNLEGRMNLHRAVFRGDGRAIIKTGENHDLNLVLKNHVHVKIEGTSHLRSLKMSGNSCLSLNRMKAQTMRVMMQGSSHAKLVGTAQLALVDLRGHANLNAQYLLATDAFIRTTDQATASVAVVKTQHVLAGGQSTIYYYKAPTYKIDFMAENGAILDMETLDKNS